MKIGIYCTNNFTYPVPDGTIYASITVAGNLADTLVSLGEDVTFFGPIGSKTNAKLETFSMLPFSDPQVNTRLNNPGASYEYEDLMMTKAISFCTENNFDIFHTHCRPFSITKFADLKPNLPIVATIHDPLTYDAYKTLPEFNRLKNLHFISLSKDQQSTCPNLNWEAVVYNGINPENWVFNETPKDYLLFVGRLIPEKGPDIAVQVAKTLNLPLKLFGSVDPDHQSFFDEKIAPFLSESIQYRSTVPQSDLPKIYGEARALLMPTKWHEPFGLVAIEAMSTGTPVVALNNGSMKEIVLDGQTGFLADSAEDLIKKVKLVSTLNRKLCRQHVVEKFSLERVAKNYLTVYRKILNKNTATPSV